MVTQRSVVKWFDAKKGYGFIVNPQGGPDIFVHYSQIETERRFKTLRTGQVVEYQLHDGPKGPHAIQVSFLDDESSEPEQTHSASPVTDGVSSTANENEAAERPLYSSF